MPLPDRPNAAPYHFHMHDFWFSQPYTLSGVRGTPGNRHRFFSLVRDLQAIAAEATNKGIPNQLIPDLRLNPAGPPSRTIPALRIGAVNVNHRVLFTGGIHAREWIGVEMPLLIAEYLVKNYVQGYAGNNPRQTKLNWLVDNREIWFVPLQNPDGHMHSIRQDRNWRKNRRKLRHSRGDLTPPFGAGQNFPPVATYNAPRHNGMGATRQITIRSYRNYRGVDCNRNFHDSGGGVGNWGQEVFFPPPICRSSCDPSDYQSYMGPSCASEPETQAMENFINNHRPHASIDYHSYCRKILYPDAAVADQYLQNRAVCLQSLIQDGLNPTWSDANKLMPDFWYGDAADTWDPLYRRGTPSGVLYPAFGSVMDFCYVANAGAAFTIELDPAPGDPIGFRLPETDIQGVFERNIRGALSLICCGGNQPQPPPAVAYPAVGVRRMNQFLNRATCCGCFKLWNVWGQGNRLP